MTYEIFLNQIYAGNSVRNYLIAMGVFLVIFLSLYLFKSVFLRKLKKLVTSTTNDVDDLLVAAFQSLGGGFNFAISSYIAAQFLNLSPFVDQIVFSIFWLILAFSIIFALHRVIDFCFKRVGNREDLRYGPTALSVFKKALKGALWGVAFVLILQNLGVDVGALIASLGIGGIALGFALKDVMSDLLASLSIYLDRPFEVGDFIEIDGVKGVVEQIGIKSTRMRTLPGDELIVSNRYLTEKKVHNYGRMKERRISFSLTFDPETSNVKLQKIQHFIKELIKDINHINPDRVAFSGFSDYGLQFDVVYYVDSPEYELYVSVQEKFNYRLKKKLEEEGINLVFPLPVFKINK